MLTEAASKIGNTPALSDALKLKGVGKDKVFARTATRNVEYVIKVLGNRSIEQYSSADAAVFRNWLLDQSSTSRLQKGVWTALIHFLKPTSLRITQPSLVSPS